MPPREWRLRIEDIIEAIEAILDFTEGMDSTSFAGDKKTVDASIRNLEVIGEAAKHIPLEIRSCYEDIPWAEMSAMRNILAHAYFGIDLSIIWQTICSDLPIILPQLRQLLSNAGQNGRTS